MFIWLIWLKCVDIDEPNKSLSEFEQWTIYSHYQKKIGQVTFGCLLFFIMCLAHTTDCFQMFIWTIIDLYIYTNQCN